MDSRRGFNAVLIICRSVCFCSRLVWSFEKSHPNAILEAGEQGFYAKTSIKDVKVKAHILHEAGEIAGNMEVASVFCSKNPGVKSIILLPNITKENEELRKNFYPKGLYPRGANKNADVIVEWIDNKKCSVDFKCMQGNGKKLLDRLNEAYQQADFSIIKMQGDNYQVDKEPLIMIPLPNPELDHEPVANKVRCRPL